MRLNSLAFRLFATSAAWTLLVLPLAGFLIYSLYRDDVQSSFDGQLKKLLTAINIDSMVEDRDEPVTPTNRYEPLFEVLNSGWYWQIKPLDDPSQRTLISASLGTSELPSPYEQKITADASGTRWLNATGPTGEPLRILEVIDRMGHKADKPRYSIIVAGPLDWLDSQISQFRNRLSIALALAGVGLLAVTLLQIRFGLSPLREIERGLAAIRSGEAARLEGELPAEIEPLKEEMNALLHSNEEIIERARTHVGNLAHALKTPLAVIINEAGDEKKNRFAKKVAEQAALMRDQVNHYLDRARMASRVAVIGRVTSVRPVVMPLKRALERIHEERQIKISISCPEDARFQGEKQDLEEILGNVLDNACKWANGQVTLDVSVDTDTDRTARKVLQITVEDDGPGLTADQRARIGKRGLRLDESKPGSGLGLSIVTDLVQTYRGRFELAASDMGGLLVRLQLPAV